MANQVEHTYNAKRADLERAQQYVKQCKQAARKLSPNMEGQPQKDGDTVDKQLARAQATTASVEAALAMLQELQVTKGGCWEAH